MNALNVVPIAKKEPAITVEWCTGALLGDPAFRLQSMAACLEACGSNLLHGTRGTIMNLEVAEITKGPDPYWGWQLSTLENGTLRTRLVAVVQINKCADPIPFFRKWVEEFCTPEAKTKVYALLHNAS